MLAMTTKPAIGTWTKGDRLIWNSGQWGIFRNGKNAVKIQEPFPLRDHLGSENYALSYRAVLQALLNFLLLLDAQIMKTPKGVFFHLCLTRCLKTAGQPRSFWSPGAFAKQMSLFFKPIKHIFWLNLYILLWQCMNWKGHNSASVWEYLIFQ